MYVRLGFVIAVNVNPDALLLDEVLAVGDESFQRKCYEKPLGFQREGKTIVFVSHDLNAVKNLCQRAIWLDKGKIEVQDSAEDVINAYLATIK